MRKQLNLAVIMALLCVAFLTESQPLYSQTGAPAGLPTDQIIVKYLPSARVRAQDMQVNSARLQAAVDAAGVTLNYAHAMSGDAHVLQLGSPLPEAEVQRIAQRIAMLPDVAYAEPDRILQAVDFPNTVPARLSSATTPIKTNDTYFSNQWDITGTYGMNMTAAWAITTGISSTVVAVIDTGYLDHTDLSGRFVQGYDFVTNATRANDTDGRDTNAHDPGDWVTSGEAGTTLPGCSVHNSTWHGTHVAGTIGAIANNGQGIAGINKLARIVPARVLGKCGSNYESDIIDGMRWAAGLAVSGVPSNANPAKVLNLSLGGSGSCSASEQSAINDINAVGAIVVIAAGNNNANAANYQPASCKRVIVVGATRKNGLRASYSNYGAIVDISAPGGDITNDGGPGGILSTWNTGTQSPSSDTYVYMDGTSMATPHVVGLVSLMVGIAPTLNFTRTEALLKSTAHAFGAGNDCVNLGCGAGIADAKAVLTFLTAKKNVYIPKVMQPIDLLLATVINGDFELGNQGWTAYSSHAYTLTMNGGFPSPVTPHSGIWAVWLGGANSETSYIEQLFYIPFGTHALSYWQWQTSNDADCSADFASVSVNGTEVDAYNVCTAESTYGWVQHLVDISAYGGTAATVRIQLVTNSTFLSNLYVDDVGLQ